MVVLEPGVRYGEGPLRKTAEPDVVKGWYIGYVDMAGVVRLRDEKEPVGLFTDEARHRLQINEFVFFFYLPFRACGEDDKDALDRRLRVYHTCI